MTYAADLPDGSVVTSKAYIFHVVMMKSIFPMPFESPCDLGARKSFPNAPDYELKLNSGLIVHLAAVRSGEGKIDVGITLRMFIRYNVVPPLVSRTVTVTGEETRRTKRSSFTSVYGWSAHTSLPTRW